MDFTPENMATWLESIARSRIHGSGWKRNGSREKLSEELKSTRTSLSPSIRIILFLVLMHVVYTFRILSLEALQAPSKPGTGVFVLKQTEPRLNGNLLRTLTRTRRSG